MITFKDGDLLEDDADVLVNTVNCVGVMGAGIALQFKERFPNNFRGYKSICSAGGLKPSEFICMSIIEGKKYPVICNLATKGCWRKPSRLSWIVKGISNLRSLIIEEFPKSIAIPALGCQNGGLKWEKVKQILEKELSNLNCDIRVYNPRGDL